MIPPRSKCQTTGRRMRHNMPSACARGSRRWAACRACSTGTISLRENKNDGWKMASRTSVLDFSHPHSIIHTMHDSMCDNKATLSDSVNLDRPWLGRESSFCARYWEIEFIFNRKRRNLHLAPWRQWQWTFTGVTTHRRDQSAFRTGLSIATRKCRFWSASCKCCAMRRRRWPARRRPVSNWWLGWNCCLTFRW